MPIRSDSDARKVLLIGDISRALLNPEAVKQLPCQVTTNMPDAIEAASKNSFAAVAKMSNQFLDIFAGPV